jgi:hypothetical protein
MKDKNIKGNPINYTITATRKDLILDKAGNPVVGYIIHYITERGSTGYIEIAEKGYTKERALELIQADVERLEELLS